MPKPTTAATYTVAWTSKGGSPSISVSNVKAATAERAVAIARSMVSDCISNYTPTVT